MNFDPLLILDPQATLSVGMITITFLVMFGATLISYVLITVPLYYYFNKRGGGGAVLLQSKPVTKAQVRHEIAWSIASIVQYAAVSTALLVAWHEGLLPKLYIDPRERGLGYFLFSIALFLLIQDLLFYLTHRALHSRKLAKFHVTHHRSKVPTVFAIYSFHPLEAFLHSIRLPLIVALIPANLFALVICEFLISNFVNAYGHLNYEPRCVRRFARLHKMVAATSTYHNLHHSKGRGNYGSYFSIWDKLFNTYIPETDQALDQVHLKLNQSS